MYQRQGCSFSNGDLVDFLRAAGFSSVHSDTLSSGTEIARFSFLNPARRGALDRGFAYIQGKGVQTLTMAACYPVLPPPLPLSSCPVPALMLVPTACAYCPLIL